MVSYSFLKGKESDIITTAATTTTATATNPLPWFLGEKKIWFSTPSSLFLILNSHPETSKCESHPSFDFPVIQSVFKSHFSEQSSGWSFPHSPNNV